MRIRALLFVFVIVVVILMRTFRGDPPKRKK
jgi:hypothetical protein